jgi:nucleotide-binding universal stress UspA family protein
MKKTTAIGKERSTGAPPVPLKPGFSRIVVPTDFSPRSEAAVNYAVELARRLGAQVTLLHLVPEPTAFDYSMGGIPAEEWEQAREEAKKKLDQELARAKITYQGVDWLVRTGISLREQIVSAAKEVSADLVVISTQGYTGWKHLLFGSDAEKLLHEAPCPVLVVR